MIAGRGSLNVKLLLVCGAIMNGNACEEWKYFSCPVLDKLGS